MIKNELLFPNLKVSKGDEARLSPHLRNYNRLNEILILNGLDIKDVQRMILIELKGKSRQFILNKLVSRLKSQEREDLLINITQCRMNQEPKLASSDGVSPMMFSSASLSVLGAKASRTASPSARKATSRS